MKVFESINDYLKHAKVGDRIVLGGRGILDGLNIEFVWETKKVVDVSEDKFYFKEFRGRKRYTIRPDYYSQRVGLLSDEDFKLLSK